MQWVQASPGAPYFKTEDGAPWTPIGQNDSVQWPDLKGLFRRRDPALAEAYVRTLRDHGVTCLRLMLEYSQRKHRYFESPPGRFKRAMVEMWDDLFGLCERYGLRVLLTPFDTFWMWRRWKYHPYNRANGGPCEAPRELLTCPATRDAIKRRLDFVIRRWSGSGALFAWDLWNEIHPAQAGDSAAAFDSFIRDLSSFVRARERELYGRSHPQTVSVFAPHIVLDRMRISDAIFRHPCLDFASTHFYAEGTIDHPRDTVAPAISTGLLMREALSEIRDARPFFDSEHGPIHTYKDHHKTLPAPFDDEYFRHMQWAHFASGGAGGGMRWPNRMPHSLTPGMRVAQRNLAGFLHLIDWGRFRRANWNEEARVRPRAALFACGDGRQAVVWILRTDTITAEGRVDAAAVPKAFTVETPPFEAGAYAVTAWNTCEGAVAEEFTERHSGGAFRFTTPAIGADMAFAIRRV